MTLPLCFIQESRLLYEEWASAHGINYLPRNLALCLRVDRSVDPCALKRALGGLVQRHSALRSVYSRASVASGAERDLLVHVYVTTGVCDPGLYRQSIAPDADVVLSERSVEVPAGADSHAAVQAAIQREIGTPIECSQPPLLRATLLSAGVDERFLVLVVPHLVADRWSIHLLERDLTALYAAARGSSVPPLPPVQTTYGDFAVWQHQQWPRGVFRQPAFYWRHRLATCAEALVSFDDLPPPLPKPKTRTYRVGVEHVEFDVDLFLQARAVAVALKTSLFTLCLGAFFLTLREYSRKQRLAVTINFANRRRAGTQQTVGCFTNAHIVDCDVSGARTGRALLEQLRHTMLQAIANQEVPLVLLWKILGQCICPASAGVSFDFEASRTGGSNGDGAFAPVVVAPAVGTFDLDMKVVQRDNRLLAYAAYSQERFSADAIRTLLTQYQTHLRALATTPDAPVSHS